MTAVASAEEQPACTNITDAAFRNPCAEQWGSPPSLHHSLKRFPNDSRAPHGLPLFFVRNARLLTGVAAIDAARFGWIGTSTRVPVVSSVFFGV
ncbi:MAG: hypothetical protein AAGB02_07425 [Pseudomonadota bacterium]